MSRGISRIEKIKKKERRREREEKEKKNKGRRRRRLRKIASFAALSNVPFDRSPLSRRFFSRRIYFRWYQSREKIPVGISSLPPSPDEIGFRWSPNVFRYSFLIGSPSIFLLSRYIFSKASFVISPFFFFFLNVVVFEHGEQKRWQVRRHAWHFSTDRPPPPLPFLSLYLAISPSRIASTRLYSGFPEVNKGRREEGEEERMERPPRVTVFKNFQLS